MRYVLLIGCCIILHTLNLSNSGIPVRVRVRLTISFITNCILLIIITILHPSPSPSHHDLEPQPLALRLECIISSVHPCKSQFATSATLCIQRKASSQYDALGATKWWSLVYSFIFCTLLHLGLALILPTMDASSMTTQNHL